jgi:hypothetical protein
VCYIYIFKFYTYIKFDKKKDFIGEIIETGEYDFFSSLAILINKSSSLSLDSTDLFKIEKIKNCLLQLYILLGQILNLELDFKNEKIIIIFKLLNS